MSNTDETSVYSDEYDYEEFSTLSEEDRVKKSGELKAEGNKYFLQGHYSQAKQLYTQAIKLDPTVTALYSEKIRRIEG